MASRRIALLWIAALFGGLACLPADGLAQVAIPRPQAPLQPIEAVSFGCWLIGAGCEDSDNSQSAQPNELAERGGEKSAASQQDLRFTFGLGAALPSFTGSDDLRRAQHRSIVDSNGAAVSDNDKIDNAGTGTLAFTQIFVTPALGIGLTYEAFQAKRDINTPGRQVTLFGMQDQNPDYTETVTIESRYLTLTWLPLRERFWRLGVLGGVGTADYRYTQKVDADVPPLTGAACVFAQLLLLSCDGGRETVYSRTNSVTGNSWLAGAYFDFGLRWLALRAGVNYVGMSLPRLSAQQPDSTTSSFNVTGDHSEAYLAVRTGF